MIARSAQIKAQDADVAKILRSRLKPQTLPRELKVHFNFTTNSPYNIFPIIISPQTRPRLCFPLRFILSPKISHHKTLTLAPCSLRWVSAVSLSFSLWFFCVLLFFFSEFCNMYIFLISSALWLKCVVMKGGKSRADSKKSDRWVCFYAAFYFSPPLEFIVSVWTRQA